MHTLFSVIHRRVNVMAGLAAVFVMIITVAAPTKADHNHLHTDTKTECVTYIMDKYYWAMSITETSFSNIGSYIKYKEKTKKESAKKYNECENALKYRGDITKINNRGDVTNINMRHCTIIMDMRDAETKETCHLVGDFVEYLQKIYKN